jgi:hypothetical protein
LETKLQVKLVENLQKNSDGLLEVTCYEEGTGKEALI